MRASDNPEERDYFHSDVPKIWARTDSLSAERNALGEEPVVSPKKRSKVMSIATDINKYLVKDCRQIPIIMQG